MKRLITFMLITCWVSMAALDAVAQSNVIVSGNVFSDGNEPLAGATVMQVGTVNAVTTDMRGQFSISVPADAVLKINYLGYAGQDINVAGRTHISVTLAQEAHVIGDVVVTALGIKRESKRLGYAVQEVDSEQISEVPATNLASSLSGKVAGLVVYNSPNFYQQDPMLLRGRSPLIVIDGVPVNSNSYDINSMDVENINVLKGSTAAALYGSKGQNGAIQITTKKGAKGKTEIDFSQRSVFRAGWIREPEVQSQYGNGLDGKYAWKDGKGGGVNDDDWVWGPKLDVKDPSTPSGWWETTQWDSPVDESGNLIPTPFLSRGKNNLENFLQAGYMLSNNVSVSTSGESGSLRAGLGYDYHRGEVPNTELNVFNASLAGNFKVSDRLTFNGTMLYNSQVSDNIPAIGYGTDNILYNLLFWTGADIDIRDFRSYWKPGQEGYEQRFNNYSWLNNPYFMTYEKLTGIKRDRTFMTGEFDYEIADGLHAKVRQSAEVVGAMNDIKYPKSYLWYSRPRTGNYELTQSRTAEYNTDGFLTYDKDFGRFEMNLMAGGSINFRDYSSLYGSTQGLKVPGIYNMGNTIDPVISTNTLTRYLRNSVFGSAGFGFDGTYYLDFALREDFSSALPTDNNSYLYPSVAGSIVLSELLNMRSSEFLKVRGSWSNVRSDLDPYAYMTTYQPGITYGQYNAMQYPATLGNAQLRPSTTNAYEVGVTGIFFNGRLNFDLTYYNALDTEMIINQTASQASGFSSYKTNGNKYQRTGGEMMLGGKPIDKPGFKWNTSFNWSLYRNILRGVSDGNDRVGNVLVGERMDKVMINKFMRSAAGELIIGDNGLPVRDSYLSTAGYADPSWMLSWDNRFSIGNNFEAGFLFDLRVGGVIYATMEEKMWYGGTHPDAVGELRDASIRGDKWTAPGVNITSGDITRDIEGNILTDNRTYKPNGAPVDWKTYVQYTHSGSNREFLMYDGTYLKMRELSLTYNLPERILNRANLGLSRVSISLVASNLFVLSSYPFSDPDEGTDSNLQFPSQRNIGFNINVKF